MDTNSIGKEDSQRPLHWTVTGVEHGQGDHMCKFFGVFAFIVKPHVSIDILCFSKNKVTAGRGKPPEIHQVLPKA